MTAADQRAFDAVRKLFRDDYGRPFEMTPGQIRLFRAIYERQHPRTQFECYTQYGKSDIVSMAVLLRSATFAEKWIILGGTKEKAGIIMGKLIKHLFENDYTLGKFQIGRDESFERIKRERSKDRVTFRVDDQGNMGEVMILSADARKKGQDAGDILIGHGSPNLVEDDAALIPDMIHGKAMRMLGGHTDNFLLKITNSFGRNHAYRSSVDESYHHIVINWRQGVEEGRITEEFVQSLITGPDRIDPTMFNSLYECTYPPQGMIDADGWMALLTEEEILAAQQRHVEASGPRRLGGDIAEGINKNACVIRQDNYARVAGQNAEPDLMKTADWFAKTMAEQNVLAENSSYDAIGVGAGVVARLHQLGLEVNGVKVGEPPTLDAIKKKDPEKYEEIKRSNPIEFTNLKAELCWLAKEWIRQGGALEPDPAWMQATKMRWKEDHEKKIKVMGKIEMRLQGLLQSQESPDVWDALCLTFFKRKVVRKPSNIASPALNPYYPDLGH